MRAKSVGVGAAGGGLGLGLAAVAVNSDSTGFSINTSLYEAGPWALLVGVVAFILLAIFKGWIIVKLHYDTLLTRCEAAETANVKLSERAALLTETNAVQARTIEKNAAVGETVNRVMNAMQEARLTSGGSS